MTFVLAIILFTNAHRTVPLRHSITLDARAQTRAEYLCKNHQFTHDKWENSFNFTRTRHAGENLARGFSNGHGSTDPWRVVRAWVKSPSHYANIVDKKYEIIGVGRACDITVALFADHI